MRPIILFGGVIIFALMLSGSFYYGRETSPSIHSPATSVALKTQVSDLLYAV